MARPSVVPRRKPVPHAAPHPIPQPKETIQVSQTQPEETKQVPQVQHNHRPPSVQDETETEDVDVLIAEATARLTITHEDVVIAVMGLTGTGKSTFIELLSRAGVQVSSGLHSCTINVGVFPFRYKDGRTVYLVDTPGFDDTKLTDTQVLKRVAAFLGATHSKSIKLAGLIYLHRITDNRMGGHALRNLTMFQKLCGRKSLSNVVLATTMWDKLDDPIEGERRENELIKHEDWWGDMRELGSEVCRHDGTVDSALCIIDYIMSLEGNGIVTALAEEIIDQKLSLESTAVGQVVRRDVLEAEARHAEEIKQVKESTDAMIEAGNKKAAAKLEEVRKQLEKEQTQREIDIRDLKKTHSDIEEENQRNHKKLVASLRKEVKQFKEQADTNKKNYDTLETSLKDIQTNYGTLQQQLADSKLEHEKALEERDKKWKKERDQWEADRREDQRRREEAREERDNKDLLSVVGSYVGGTVLAGVGFATFQPGLVALAATTFAGGAATAAKAASRS